MEKTFEEKLQQQRKA